MSAEAVASALPGGLDAALVTVPLDSVEAALSTLPAAAGVVQLLADEGRNLVIGRAANLRRWAAARLGAGPPPRPGKRPPLDLRPVARSIRFARSSGEFQQRLLFERLMARSIRPSARRDLRPPAWIHLDTAERFPRLTVRGPRAARGGGPLYGPFRDARAAARARDLLHKRIPLRPCEYVFEPHPELPLGLGCVYAQTRTCAAPCLQRVSEAEYHTLAEAMAAVLRGPRTGDEALPDWVSTREPARALIVDPVSRGFELYPVREGRVLEEAALRCGAGSLEEAARSMEWPAPPEAEADWPWLLPWLHAPRRKGHYLPLGEGGDPAAAAARVRAAVC